MPFVRFILQVIATLTIGALIVFIGWILAAGCSRAHILVTNQSDATLSNLVISGSCKERRADTLAARSEWQTSTPYHSGGLIQFSFVSAGKNYITNSDMDINHSGFCAISFTVVSNMVVKSGVTY